MIKKYLIVATIVLVLVSCAKQKDTAKEAQGAELTMGSWRTDDVAQMNTFLGKYAETSGVQIKFQPTNPPEYNSTLRLWLESGTGPDVFYARSFSTGQELYSQGYLRDLSDLAGIKSNYSAENLAPYLSEDGKPFAVPFVAVSHGIYYNKDIFQELGLSVPQTWDDLLAVAKAVKAANYIPFANGIKDEWDILEVFLLSFTPNVIGGAKGRLAYENGQTPFNDEKMVSLFAQAATVEPYLPEGYAGIGYNDSNALFATGKAAMYFDGSWSLGTFADVDFEWGVFAPPPSVLGQGYITFHPDAGMAANAASKYPTESLHFLEWLGSSEGAQVAAENLPLGFFPTSSNSVAIANQQANEFFKLNEGRGTDVRFPWPRLMTGEPSGYQLLNTGVIQVILGKQTPKQAADALAEGLAKWYVPH